MDTETPSAPTGEIERRTVLGPFLEQLRLLGRSGAALPSTIQLGSGALELSPWETQALARALGNEPGNPDAEWCDLLVEGVAFQSKFLAELDELARSERIPANALAPLHGRLLTDAAVGLNLLDETQTAIDVMVARGRMDQAKKLSGFRAKIAKTVTQIKGRLSEKAFSEAQSLAAGMVSQGEPRLESKSVETEELAPDPFPGPEATRRDAPAQSAPVHENKSPAIPAIDEGELRGTEWAGHSERRSRRTLPTDVSARKPSARLKRNVTLALIALIAVGAAVILPRLMREPLLGLMAQDVPRSSAVVAVVSNPPGMVVKVDGEIWEQMPLAERQVFVDQLGQTAAKSGYTEVRVETTGGSAVGQWTKTKGGSVFDRSGSP